MTTLAEAIADPSSVTLQGPAILAAVDGLEALATTLNGYVDGLETLHTTLNGYVDGLEGLVGTTNTTLTTLAGYTDTLETLIGATNTKLDTLNGYAADGTTPSPTSQVGSVVTFTPTLDTAAYTSGDVLFVSSPITNAARGNGLTTFLQSLSVTDKSDQKPALTLYFFDTSVTFGTLNGTPSISDADAANCLGYFSIAAADWKDLGGADVVNYRGSTAPALVLKAASGSQSVYCAATLDAGTPTFGASDLVFRFGFAQ